MEERILFSIINGDLQAAMKARAVVRLDTLRMMKAKILLVNARGELDDSEIIKILNSYAKQLKEAIEEFKKVGKTETVIQTEKELHIVEEYLPKSLSDEEIRQLVEKTIGEVGVTSAKDMGKVMKPIKAAHPTLDGNKLKDIVLAILK